MAGDPTNPNTIIFVWDLDQTLAHPSGFKFALDYTEPHYGYLDPEYGFVYINYKMLVYIHKLINSPRYGANLLLTNNSDGEYIERVSEHLTKVYNIMYPDDTEDSLFDNIYTAERNEGGYTTPRVLDETVPVKRRSPNHLAKRLEDVANMVGIEPSESLARRVFFFDDLPNHKIRAQIGDNYIQIRPPFRGSGKDTTDYSRVEQALVNASNNASNNALENASNSSLANDTINIIVHKGGAYKKTRKRKGNARKAFIKRKRETRSKRQTRSKKGRRTAKKTRGSR
jgi:hypothetical protein